MGYVVFVLHMHRTVMTQKVFTVKPLVCILLAPGYFGLASHVLLERRQRQVLHITMQGIQKEMKELVEIL